MTALRDLEGRTNALRKGIRTALQVVVALAPNIALAASGLLSPTQALALSAALTPVVSAAQNLLEDRGVIGTWLRRPTPAMPDARWWEDLMAGPPEDGA